jgi:hypothetical protein
MEVSGDLYAPTAEDIVVESEVLTVLVMKGCRPVF